MSMDNEELQYVHDLIETHISRKQNKIKSDFVDVIDYYFPITEINGVKCKCSVRYIKQKKTPEDEEETKAPMYMFFIDNNNDGFSGEMANLMFVYQNASLIELLKHIFDTIPKLKLTAEGEFSVEPEDNKLIDVLLKIPNVKTRYEDCCVCANYTTTKTRCRHSLCYKCWTQLPTKFEDEDYYQECPICRDPMPVC